MKIRALTATAAAAVGLCCAHPSAAQLKEQDQTRTFNRYVVAAVKQLEARQAQSGYNINRAYSQPVAYGEGHLKATEPPYTMCVAAVAEVLVIAINNWVNDHPESRARDHLPLAGWNRMRPSDFRAHLWVAPQLGAYGSADAFVTFAVGKRVPFSELLPGAFINLNRPARPDKGKKASGHAVIFLGFVDIEGRQVETYDAKKVAGFRYFSANGGLTPALYPSGGFYERLGFFNKPNGQEVCPRIPGARIDCNIMLSASQKFLNTGYVLAPTLWDAKLRDQNLKALSAKLYAQAKTRGPDFLGLPSTLTKEQFDDALATTDTLALNPIYAEDQ